MFKNLKMFRPKKIIHSQSSIRESGIRILEHLTGDGVAVFFDAVKFKIGATTNRIWMHRSDLDLTKKDLGNENYLVFDVMATHMIGLGTISLTICS